MSRKNIITAFQKTVYKAVQQVPKGRVTTYKALAEHLNCGSPRAIGQALKHNPFAPEVPCHRAICSNLTIGGFRGKTSGPEIRQKMNLLASEGVTFKYGKLMDPKRIFTF